MPILKIFAEVKENRKDNNNNRKDNFKIEIRWDSWEQARGQKCDSKIKTVCLFIAVQQEIKQVNSPMCN